MKRIISIALAFSTFCAFGQDLLPVNKAASPEAKKLLDYIYSIYGKHILSGQHNYNDQMDRYNDSVVSISGKSPAIWSTDFIWNGTKDPGERIVAESIKKHKEGYLITLMWHQGRPIDNPPYGWKESIQAKLDDTQWRELTTSGTVLHKRWLDQVDKVAEHLKKLQDAHVPILWRPYHEMNGVWFWWGNKKGKDGLAKLWQMMYDRYTNYHKLNNLIWVWGANGPRDIPKDEAYPYKDFYPGHKYVDILGTDIYNMDYEQRDYNELLKLAEGRPIALTEVGELPKPEILEAQPKWVWFVVWSNWLWEHNSRQLVKEVYDMPRTLTLDEQNAL
ncbi:glycosyl hydrolase [Arcticibacter eurypsychrophilus]|uniref:glycosyl hydrolase n=1 Tax=Arcticibacter eurypsychrophilus TaxID=1434752 RepID=UPI00084DB90D|nr:glycosyl hydrolase [Arcticibacter eurypsychrophilus]